MSLTIRRLVHHELQSAIDDLARLRIEVFAAWPYLYRGDLDYEATYLREFLAARDSVLVAAYDGKRIVGAATASPMSAQKAEIRGPFETIGRDTSDIFYFGESVLLPEYRGQGVGHAFFDQREAHAANCGARSTAFVAVIRPDEHPLRPHDYVPLHAFWKRRGYASIDGLSTTLAWQDIGEEEETLKSMQFWVRGQ
jgi:GNAT superfamily N-acetyltransferase|tara:strand:- start:6127 stop:6714 length:588 start_codon:yes stop_codon:yes gene_type:complete